MRVDLSLPVVQAVDMTNQGVQALAKAVKARRQQLGLAQSALADRGGPSVVVVGQIERGQQEHPQGLTLARLDRSLGWEPGSAAAILDGGEARPVVGGLVTASGGGTLTTGQLGSNALATSLGTVGLPPQDEPYVAHDPEPTGDDKLVTEGRLREEMDRVRDELAEIIRKELRGR